MNKLDTLRMMIRHFPGGIEVVALRLGKAASTLDKELRAAPGYKLGALDADEISSMCIEAGSEHCRAYVNAVAGRGGCVVELPALDIPLSPKSLRTGLADVVKEASDVLQVGLASLEDGDVSDNEKRAFDRELAHLQGQIQQVQQGVSAAWAAGRAGRAHCAG